MLASVGWQAISMEKSKNFVSRKFTVDECNSNPNVHFNRCKKEPKPSVLAPLAPPGRFELPTFRLGGERYYPAELRRLIHNIQFFCNLWQAALLPLRSTAYHFVNCSYHIFPCCFFANCAAWRQVNLHKFP